MASFSTIQTQITNAPDPSTGLVPWIGSNGEKSILDNLNETLRDKGILYAADLTALSSISGNDAHIVYVNGLGIYNWIASTPPMPLPTGAITATGGGYWSIMAAYGNIYREVVDTSSGLTFNIEHNIGWVYDYPAVRAIDTANPHTLIPIATVTYPDENNVSITFSGSYSNKQIVVLVQV